MGKSCFQAFDPSDYTEVRQYQNNPAFQSDETGALLPLANKALIFFTRADSAYEEDANKRYSHIAAEEQRKLDRAGKVAFPAFSTVPFQAFRVDRADFDKAVEFCCKRISDNSDDEEGSRCQDTEALDKALRNEFFENTISFTAQSGQTYSRPQLLGIYALWKLDKVLLALKNNLASDVKNLMVDVMSALQIADKCYERKKSRLLFKKEESERQANAGKESHKNLDDIKVKAIALYTNEGKIKKWRSVRQAAKSIFDRLQEVEKKRFVSPEGAQDTIWDWLTAADPHGEYSSYKKKSSG